LFIYDKDTGASLWHFHILVHPLHYFTSYPNPLHVVTSVSFSSILIHIEKVHHFKFKVTNVFKVKE
jgi:hypothetical protein